MNLRESYRLSMSCSLLTSGANRIFFEARARSLRDLDCIFLHDEMKVIREPFGLLYFLS